MGRVAERASVKVVDEKPLNLMEAAGAAFRRDLPALIAHNAGKVVAYRGSERLFIQDDPASLYQKIRNNNISFKDVLIRRIEPEDTEIHLNW
jgi:hypothetical protein